MQPPFMPSERANVNGEYDFEEQLGGPEQVSSVAADKQRLFELFDFVNPRALQEEFFRVARTFQADVDSIW